MANKHITKCKQQILRVRVSLHSKYRKNSHKKGSRQKCKKKNMEIKITNNFALILSRLKTVCCCCYCFAVPLKFFLIRYHFLHALVRCSKHFLTLCCLYFIDVYLTFLYKTNIFMANTTGSCNRKSQKKNYRKVQKK